MSRLLELEIEETYQALQPHGGLGWRFLMTPQRTLTSAEVVILTLNPGGSKVEPPCFSRENGNGYFDEQWDGHRTGLAPLQRQMQALCEHLGYPLRDLGIGYLVPFRSPRWAALGNRAASLAFGIDLWKRLLAASPARLIVLMGCHRSAAVRSAFGLTQPPDRQPTGWGQVGACFWRGDDVRSYLGLPHLSRFAVFGRSTDAAKTFYGWLETVTAPQAAA